MGFSYLKKNFLKDVINWSQENQLPHQAVQQEEEKPPDRTELSLLLCEDGRGSGDMNE